MAVSCPSPIHASNPASGRPQMAVWSPRMPVTGFKWHRFITLPLLFNGILYHLFSIYSQVPFIQYRTGTNFEYWSTRTTKPENAYAWNIFIQLSGNKHWSLLQQSITRCICPARQFVSLFSMNFTQNMRYSIEIPHNSVLWINIKRFYTLTPHFSHKSLVRICFNISLSCYLSGAVLFTFKRNILATVLVQINCVGGGGSLQSIYFITLFQNVHFTCMFTNDQWCHLFIFMIKVFINRILKSKHLKHF